MDIETRNHARIIADFLKEDLINLSKRRRYGKLHPIYAMAVGANSLKSQVKLLANAITVLSATEEGKDFLQKTKPRLLDEDVTIALPAVGEIIAYAELISGNFNVAAQPTSPKKPTPEFVVQDTQGNQFVVEVFSKQMGGYADKQLKDDDKQIKEIGREISNFNHTIKKLMENVHLTEVQKNEAIKKKTKEFEICMGQKLKSHPHFSVRYDDKRKIFQLYSLLEINPYGKPNSESSILDAISRIAAIKQRNHQAQENIPFILWVDLQNQGDFHLGDSSFADPVINWQDKATSGFFWHGVYGRKGLPVFDNYALNPGEGRQKQLKMAHDGKFLQKGADVVSGIFFRFESELVFFENPYAKNKISDETRNQFLQLSGFDGQKSVANFTPQKVNQEIAEKFRAIFYLAKNLQKEREADI